MTREDLYATVVRQEATIEELRVRAEKAEAELKNQRLVAMCVTRTLLDVRDRQLRGQPMGDFSGWASAVAGTLYAGKLPSWWTPRDSEVEPARLEDPEIAKRKANRLGSQS